MDQDLYVAATTGDNDRIIDLKNKINQVSGGKHTVLHLAALCNKSISVNAILQNFPDLLPMTNIRNETALHLAAKKGYFLVVKPLINYKSQNPNYSSQDFIRKANVDGNTALHLAAQRNHRTVVEEIVNADPTDKHTQNKKSETPLYLAARRGHKDVIELILNTCKAAAIDGPEGKTALHGAVISRDADCVKLILQKRGDIANKIDHQGWTAMHYAAFHNCVELLPIIEGTKGTQYNNQNLPQRDSHMDNPMKKTPLHIAASQGHVSMVQELINLYGLTSSIIRAVDEDGRNILHTAVDQKHIEVVKCILRECSDLDDFLNKKDKKGNTPFHLLVMRGSFIPELIHHPKIDRSAINKDNFTPSDVLYWEENIIGDQIKEALDEGPRSQGWKFWGINKSEPNVGGSLVPSSKRSRKEAKFLIDKKKLMKEKVQMYRDRTTTQIVVTALITTISFTVGFTMPGGYRQDEDKVNYGSAVLSKKTYFKICMIADAVALFFSTFSLFLYFLSSLYEDPKPVSTFSTASVVLNIISVVAMMVTFVTGTYVVLPHSIPLAVIVLIFSGLFFTFVGVLSLKLILELILGRTATKKIKV